MSSPSTISSAPASPRVTSQRAELRDRFATVPGGQTSASTSDKKTLVCGPRPACKGVEVFNLTCEQLHELLMRVQEHAVRDLAFWSTAASALIYRGALTTAHQMQGCGAPGVWGAGF